MGNAFCMDVESSAEKVAREAMARSQADAQAAVEEANAAAERAAEAVAEAQAASEAASGDAEALVEKANAAQKVADEASSKAAAAQARLVEAETALAAAEADSAAKAKYMAELTASKGTTVGGGDAAPIMGGYSNMEGYGNSLYSEAKEKLIRSIAKDVAGILKISSSFAESGDLKDVVSKFAAVVPDPRKRRKIKADKGIHADVCKKIAAAINRNYKTDLINVNDSPENVCNSVSELLYSLFTGLHGEFLSVSADVARILNNLSVLQDYVDQANQKLMSDAGNNSENEASMTKDVYDALSREIRRQQAYLANISSSVVGPTGESLIQLIEENKEFEGLTADLKGMAGSREFTDKLSYMMSGTASVAHAAFLVDKALKQLGMSVSDYKSAKNLKDLQAKVYDHLVKKKPNSKELHKLLIASEVLSKPLNHKDIAAHLSKKGGDYAAAAGGGITGGDFAAYGGDHNEEGLGYARLLSDKMQSPDDSVFKGRAHADKHSVGKQLQKREKYRETLTRGLNGQVQSCYQEIVMELNKIGKKIGSEVKVSDELRTFVRQLGYLSEVHPERKNISSALSGYPQDVNSQYIKHDFLRSLDATRDAADALASGSGGSYFRSLSSALNKLRKIVDDFNDTFTKVLTEVHVEADRSHEGKTGGDYGAGASALAGAEMTFGGAIGFKYVMTLKKAIREIEYYFKIANIKSNLRIAASQQSNYTKDYENILGEECGMLIDAINNNYKAITCESETSDGCKALAPNMTVCEVHNKFNNKEQWKAYKFILEYMRSSKVEMIEAAQALDLYLSKFTEQLQRNPDDIKDIVKLLEQIEIVAKWFTEKSGDNLAAVFEANGLAPVKSEDQDTGLEIKGHYYEAIKEDNPGDWKNGLVLNDMKMAKNFVIRLEKSFKSMRALENVISTFSRLSNKAGGDDIQTFMSPGLIFKAFMKYSVATSLALGKGGGEDKYCDFLRQNDAATIATVFLRPATADGKGVVDGKCYYDPLAVDKDYLSTDEIFEMSIKSMVAKVFTVVGAYSLYQRPAKSFNRNKALSNKPLRQIMGGGSSVKVIPEATELYIRLTLLAEWYRELFGFSKRDKPDLLISMIPAFDGIWADFVKVIFVDAAAINDGGYTESFSEDLVTAINDIYSHYRPKYGADTCTKVLENFVAEVNLRYGMIKQDEINRYLNAKSAGLNDNTYDDVNEQVDYDILGADAEFGKSKPAPSARFQKVNPRTGRKSVTGNKHFKNQVDAFRKKVEEALKLNKLDNMKGLNGTTDEGQWGELGLKYRSVDDLVAQVSKRVKAAGDDDTKYKIIQSTILGVERYADVDYDVMLMFHETVINPLTILYTIYKMINHFNRFANSMNLGDKGENVTSDACKATLKALSGNDKYRDGETHNHLYFNDGDYDKYWDGGDSVIMEDTINHLFYLTCDKNPMVEMYFAGDGKDNRYPMLSFKKLEKHCMDLVANVQESITKFRKYMPHEIVARYEKSTQKDFKLNDTTPTDPNVVSLFYLKEHLVDRLIKNKYRGGLSDANLGLKNIWKGLTKDGESYGSVFAKLTYWDSKILYEFDKRDVFKNQNWSRFPINVIGLTKQSELSGGRLSAKMVEAVLSGDGKNIKGAQSDFMRGSLKGNLEESDASMGFKGVYDDDAIESTRASGEGPQGLVFKLNRLLYHYINMFTDRTSNKLYLPLLEKFANGKNAREIMKGQAIDDVSADGDKAMFPSKEIDSKSVLFATMARAIRNIVTDKKQLSTATLLNLAEPNLLNVSDYMKDMMTAYLPVFEKQLNIICAKADLLKSLMENTSIKVKGVVPGDKVADGEELETAGAALSLRKPKNADHEADSKTHLIEMLSAVNSTARSLQSCVKNVYKELADVPLYFETYQNSITDYKNRNGNLPLMPLSHVSHLLNNQHRLVEGNGSKLTHMPNFIGGDDDDDSDEKPDEAKHNSPTNANAVRIGLDNAAAIINAPTTANLMYHCARGLLPHADVGVGSDEFKFAYGTRGLLSDATEPSIDLAPGVLGVLDTYNSKVGGAASYDKKKVVDSFTTSVHLLRFATDYIYHKTYLSDQDLNKSTMFYVVGTGHSTMQDGSGRPNVNVLQHLACQTGHHSFNNNVDLVADGLRKSNDQFFLQTGNIALLVENDNQKQAVHRMLRCILATPHDEENMYHANREAMRIYNILDANIVPINFHALQREIAMANLYNYSYTFDRLVEESLGVTGAIGAFPEDALVEMLQKPRGERNEAFFYNNVGKLMAGNDGLSLNRPKYLSDQLWNKVLLQSSFGVGNSTGNGSFMGSDLARRSDTKTFTGNRSSALTYLGNVGHKAHKHMVNIKTVGLGDGLNKMQDVGRGRYDTMCVRYIEWFVHIQRVMRLLMRDQLSWVDDPIVHQLDAVNSEVTDYPSNQKFSLGDFE
jgi:hypothetical protein